MIISAIILGWIFNITAGRVLIAKFSTWPVLNRWKILSPQAPIVINNRQTIRVSDSGDIAAAVNDVKSKISSVAQVSGNTLTTSGGAINLTSDGSFVTAAGTFKNKNQGVYYVVLNDGSSAKITEQVSDPATSLVFFKAALNNVPVANLDSSKNMSVGDKILFAQDSLQKFYIKSLVSQVSFNQKDVEGQTFLSDFPSRSFGSSSSTLPEIGQAVVNTNGNVIGIWNGSNVISSDVLKQAMALYFNSPQKIQRPAFGFTYSIIIQTDSRLIGLPEGALVKAVDSSSAARSAGLGSGDVITKINGQAISEANSLEEILEQFKPDSQISLTVIRKGQTVSLNLTVGELK